MKTRERILHKSLELFNDLGEPNVTTLLIADELEISPGNLYYHFKSKSDILVELFAWYESDINALLDAPSDSTEIEDQWLFLHLIFENIAKYRFLYKDLVNVLERYEKITTRFQRIMNKKRKASLTLLNGLRERGDIRASEAEVAALAENIILTTTFWINHAIIIYGDLDGSSLSQGVYQVISQVTPYLSGEQRELLDELKSSYL